MIHFFWWITGLDQDWARRSVLPKIRQLSKHDVHLFRISAMLAIRALAPVIGMDIICSQFFPLLDDLSKDSVSNVRMNVAKTIQILIPHIDPSAVTTYAKPILMRLHDDEAENKDVKHFAFEALKLL
eukprot:TRINITY_DN6223_c0_g1_i3.p1 TRINITY_DN6223_c0_g1~~TRINITY_DN6223_c0_g1_i3.p1  ORF type:complete len:127 (+),score=17.66 TRINITY_DN6223_c0_g1_i3:118-498(+)